MFSVNSVNLLLRPHYGDCWVAIPFLSRQIVCWSSYARLKTLLHLIYKSLFRFLPTSLQLILQCKFIVVQLAPLLSVALEDECLRNAVLVAEPYCYLGLVEWQMVSFMNYINDKCTLLDTIDTKLTGGSDVYYIILTGALHQEGKKQSVRPKAEFLNNIRNNTHAQSNRAAGLRENDLARRLCFTQTLG